MRRKISIFFLILALLFVGARLYYHFTDDFRQGNLLRTAAKRDVWEISPLSPLEKGGLAKILDQEYRYFGKGAQSYAFESADGIYVLKLFKSKHFKPNLLVEWLPSTERFTQVKNAMYARKKLRKENTLSGYHLAYALHKEGAGLLYIHLNPTDQMLGSVDVRDKLGFKRRLDLDQLVFVVQEKGEKLRDVIRKLLDQGKVKQAKKHLRKIFDLYIAEYRKGIYDRDHGVMHNTGFVGKRPIHLDVGKLSHDPEILQSGFFRDDLAKVLQRMESYFASEYPEHVDTLFKDITQHLAHELREYHY